MKVESSTKVQLDGYFESNEFIYIIYTEYGSKIGISANPRQRLEQIKQGLPSQYALFIGLYKGENAAEYERKLHKRFKPRNISGEWFVLNQENLDEIHSFLISNKFTCEIKISLLWANYLAPSIFLKGNIRIIEVEKELNKRKVSVEYPEELNSLILDPKIDDTDNLEHLFLSATQISKRLEGLGYFYTPKEIGHYLSGRGIKSKSRKIPKVGVRKVYELCFNDIKTT